SLGEYEYQSVLQKLKQEAESLKKKLSVTQSATAKIAPLLIHEGIPKNLTLEITKEDFEGLIRPFIEKSREIVAQALERAGKAPDDISKVILVGGSTLIPMVKRMVAGTIKEPYRATDPAKSVAMGAAIYNYLMHLPNSKVKVGQITRQIFGTEAIVNLATMEKRLIPIIPMGTTIPTEIKDDKFKALEGSSAVRVDVFQWEEGCETERKFIGSLVLEGIETGASLEIKYSINEDNLFEVFVKDQKTGKVVSAQLDRSKSLPKLPDRGAKTETKGMNIVFIIDTTSSMDLYIKGVQEKAIEFSNILKDKNIDFKLGLIGFGDLLEKEKPTVYKFTDEVAKFQKHVRKIPRTYGGDLPESSLDALETALLLMDKSKLNGTHKNIFILITDAPPHIPTQSGQGVMDIVARLNAAHIGTYVVARKDRVSLEAYEPLVRAEGKYYSMDDSFHDILDSIAYSIAELVRL
ncbi:MAG: Hsp70 family protein, partial [Vallitaleaceae bacterium]|nr:Hsp70 family protein [Vallitaleaceae bacterium]